MLLKKKKDKVSLTIEISVERFMYIFKMLLIFNFLLVQKFFKYSFQCEG